MGIMSAIKICFDDTQAEFLKTVEARDRTINEDYQYFQHQNWYRFKDEILFDPNKFIFLFTQYKKQQQRMLKLWKIVDFKKIKAVQKTIYEDCILSDRWKFAIRRGVPIIHYKTMIELFFQKRLSTENKNKYKSLIQINIKNNKNNIQPTSFWKQSQQTYKKPFLNQTGQKALKRITFVLSKSCGQLEQNPYIVNFISILFIFVDEPSAYQITRCLIESSFNANEQKKQMLKYHFTLNSFQFLKMSERFYKSVKKLSPTVNVINRHLNTQGIDKIQIFKQVVGSFFFGYLPFSVILKIFIQYLNEGVEILFRVFYAILKVSGPGIRDSSSTKQILRIIKSKMLNFLSSTENMNIFFRYSFDLQLESKTNIRVLELESMKSRSSDLKTYYLPTVKGQSQILSYQNMETIWGYLPSALKHYDIQKIYPQSNKDTHGCLKEMLKVMKECIFTLIIIQSIKGQIFGVFLASKIEDQEQIKKKGLTRFYESTPLLNASQKAQCSPLLKSASHKQKKNNNKDLMYFGSSDSFVLTILPESKKYSSSGANVFYCAYNENCFVIGGPASRPALQLDSSLSIGLSFECPTYQNLPLHNGPPGQFRIKKIECFSIQ